MPSVFPLWLFLIVIVADDLHFTMYETAKFGNCMGFTRLLKTELVLYNF